MTGPATGNFATTPFPQILVFLRKRGLTGTLTIDGVDGQQVARIAFSNGKVACVTGGGCERLGELLVIRGKMNAKSLAAALRGSREGGMRLGRWLVEQQVVAEQDLQEAIEFQIERRLTGLYGLERETFSFAEGELADDMPEQAILPVDPARGIAHALRDSWVERRLDGQLERLAGHGIAVKRERDADPRWDEEQMRIVAALEKATTTLEAVRAMDGADGHTARLVLYSLMLTNGLELVAPPQAGAGPREDRAGGAQAQARAQAQAQPARTATASASGTTSDRGAEASRPEEPKIAAARAEAEAKLADIETRDHFKILEIERNDDLEKIRASHARLIKKFHPDRVAASPDRDLRDKYLRISTKLRESFDIITDPEKRVKLGPGGGETDTDRQEQEIVKQALSTELEFQKAGVLARKKKWADVSAIMAKVVQADEGNGDYLALYNWARACEQPAGTSLTEYEAGLKRAVSLAPRSEKASWYLAQVLRRTGKDREALVLLETVLKLNPHNIDAKRDHMILERKLAMAKASGSGNDGGGEQHSGGSALDKLKRILTKKL